MSLITVLETKSKKDWRNDKMNNECKIISDLLPLYAEDMVCEETAEFIKNHLSECENCKNDAKIVYNLR